MSLIIRVEHLPSGQSWESGRFADDKAGEIHALLSEADRLHFVNPQYGTVYLPPGVLDKCVIKVRHTQ